MMRFAPTRLAATTRLAAPLGAAILAAAFVLTAHAPARADYAVVRFADGNCQIWSNAGDTPWGTNWSKIAITPDWSLAQAALDDAVRGGACYY
jgi:hypothetical protein